MRSTRRWKLRVAVAATSVVVTLGIAELGVRIAAIEPMTVKVHAVVPDKTENPLGLRDRLDRVPVDPELLRVAFLGDSFTFGLGVEPDKTFVKRIGHLLKERYSGWSMAVNLGRDGADLISEYAVYNRVRDTVRPQIVVHVLSQNDLDFGLYRSFDPIARLATERLFPSRYSRLFEYVESRIRLEMADARSKIYMLGGPTPEQRDLTWRLASHEIEATRKLAEEGGAAYALVRFPRLREVDSIEDYSLAEVHRRTAELAERLDILYLDLLEAFRGKSPSEMCLLSYDDHPSPAAHDIAAEAITSFLLRKLIPKVRPLDPDNPAMVRSPEQIDQAEIRHYKQVLQIDPNCFSAQFHLEWRLKARQSTTTSSAPSPSSAPSSRPR